MGATAGAVQPRPLRAGGGWITSRPRCYLAGLEAAQERSLSLASGGEPLVGKSDFLDDAVAGIEHAVGGGARRNVPVG